MDRSKFLYNYHSHYYAEMQDSHKFDLEILIEDFIATHALYRLEFMIERFVATQNLQTEEFRKQILYTNEIFWQLNSVVESIVTHNKEMETQISLLAQTPLGPFPEKHMDVVTTTTEKSIENPKEIEKDPLTPPEREVVEEVEKEVPCVVPPLYKSPIPFSQRSVEVKVDSLSERYMELLENIHTNTPLFKILEKKRKL